jgi:DNA-binding NtrC family response regulator
MLVDDDLSHLEYTARMIEKNFTHQSVSVNDSREVLNMLSGENFCLILLDLNMPHINGLDLLTDINYKFPEIPVVIVTAAEGSETVVSAVRQGAFDYVTKSSGKNRLIAAVSKAIKHYFTMAELDKLKKEFLEPSENGNIQNRFITNSHKMMRLFSYMRNISPTPTPVLITGETGVGKELIAELIYEMSGMKGRMVKVNVSGLDDTVFSDTLFGHLKGAFTGAEGVREGLVKSAENGVLFLDEIGDLEQSSQVKLLRLLQDNSYYPLGSDTVRQVNTKIVAATNRNLKEMTETGEFRKDLFYRLMFHNIVIPPLRERREDIFPIIEHLINEISGKIGTGKPQITTPAMMLMTGYDYPGNVRELEGLLYDLVADTRSGLIEEKTVVEQFRKKGLKLNREGGELNTDDSLEVRFRGPFPSIREINDHMIKLALEEAEGNISKAAAMLGINRQTIYRHLSE